LLEENESNCIFKERMHVKLRTGNSRIKARKREFNIMSAERKEGKWDKGQKLTDS
jgi:hypothetical protein